jgi:probable F420-dependent oxidoreductase
MPTDVEFGTFLISMADSETANPAAFDRLAAATEAAGLDALCVGDHVAIPEEIPDTYPFSASGRSPFAVDQDIYDAFQVLAYLAAQTDDLLLGTNTTIAPYRHPVTMTKHALTLDALSGGRFELGIAPGWMETEFEVLDVPYEERGSRTDEFLAILDRAREEAEFAFEGPHRSFQTTGFYPRPPAEGRPPIWIGGYSGASFRRLGEVGHGWTIFPADPDEVRDGLERAEHAWEDHDREGDPEVAVALNSLDLGVEDGELVGDREGVIEELSAYVEAGATRIYVFPQLLSRELDEQATAVDLLAEDVFPEV